MPITLDCPRCKQTLAVPAKKAGTYVRCPRCNGRFWVPESLRDSGTSSPGQSPAAEESDLNSSLIVPLNKPPLATPPGMATSSASHPETPLSSASPPPPSSSSASLAVPPPSPPPSVPAPSAGTHPGSKPALNPAGGVTKFDWMPPTASRSSSPEPPPPPVLPPTRKVARFVAAEAPASGLKLAEDGKLPELRLQEGQAERSDKKRSGMNPLALAALLSLSVAMSIAMVVFNPSRQGSLNTVEQRKAWREIEADYFSNIDPNAPLELYQVYLREARQAATRGDGRTASDRLRRVLAMLRAERGGLEEKQRRFEGTQWGQERTLTGSPHRDVKLEEYIAILLRHGP